MDAREARRVRGSERERERVADDTLHRDAGRQGGRLCKGSPAGNCGEHLPGGSPPRRHAAPQLVAADEAKARLVATISGLVDWQTFATCLGGPTLTVRSSRRSESMPPRAQLVPLLQVRRKLDALSLVPP